MEALSTQAAAARLRIGVSKFHRKVAELGLSPVLQAPGPRGAMFWSEADVDAIRRQLVAEAEAIAAAAADRARELAS